MKAGDPILIVEPFCPLPEDDGVARWHESEYSQVLIDECYPHPGIPVVELVEAVRDARLFIRSCVNVINEHEPTGSPWFDGLVKFAGVLDDLVARMEDKP